MFDSLRRRIEAMKSIKDLLSGAEDIARREGSAQPAAEHLLLAALDLPDGTARAALARVGVSAEALGAAIRAQHGAALESVGVIVDQDAIAASLPEPGPATGVYRSEASARDLFQRAASDARAGGGRLVGAHVVRAAATLERGTVARTLQHLGVDREALLAAATAEIDTHHR